MPNELMRLQSRFVIQFLLTQLLFVFLFSYFIEQKTLSTDSFPPDRPDFVWEQLPSENGFATIKVNWIPNVSGKPGTHFYTKYREKGDTTWLTTDYELNNDYTIIRGLQPDKKYEFVAISVDGEHLAESQIQDVTTVGIGKQRKSFRLKFDVVG